MERKNYDSDEFKSDAGTIRHVNVSKNKHYKLTNTISAVLLLSTVLISSLTSCSNINAMKKQNNNEPSTEQEIILNIEEEYIKVITEVPIERGDNVSTFAELYYKDDFSKEYKDIKEYEQAIISENGLSKDGFIIAGGTLKIPVIIKSNDPYYLRYQEALSNLENFDQVWINHIVSFGDSLWSLSSQSCIEDGDIVNTIEQIKSKNGIKGSNLNVGMNLLIKNPELKKLKQEVVDARDEFNASLITSQKVRH